MMTVMISESQEWKFLWCLGAIEMGNETCDQASFGVRDAESSQSEHSHMHCEWMFYMLFLKDDCYATDLH